MSRYLSICAYVVLNLVLVFGQTSRFKVLYEWNYVNFTWPSGDALQRAISTGNYIPENNLISGLKYFEDYIYLTVPRMKQGVPATLARIPALAYDKDTEPLLEPFPSWDMNTEGDCAALQNVQNVEIDTKGLLWILDGGRTRTMTKMPSVKCQPRLLIFDIKSNSTVTNYVFPQVITDGGSFLYDLVVDDADGGYAYITDNSGADPGIIVFSMKQNRAWIVRDQATMRASQDATEFRVNGTALSAPINIAGIALGPRTSGNAENVIVSQDRMVYYCPLSSFRLYAVSSAVLRNEKNSNIGAEVKDLGRKSSQTDGMVMDENGVLYYGLLGDNSIAKWNSKNPFTTSQRVIARDAAYIQWPDSIAFDMSGNLLVVTNKLQKFIYGKLNLSEPNYRILESYVGVKSYLYGVPMEILMINTTPGADTTMTTTSNPENLNFSQTYYKTYSAVDNEWSQPTPTLETSTTKENSATFIKSSILILIPFLSVILFI